MHKAALDASDAARDAAEQLTARYRQQAEQLQARGGSRAGPSPGPSAPASTSPPGALPGGDLAAQVASLPPTQAAAALSAQGKGLADVYEMYVEMVSNDSAASDPLAFQHICA